MHRKQTKSWTTKTIHQKLQNNNIRTIGQCNFEGAICKLPTTGEQRPGKKTQKTTTCWTPGVGPYKELKLSWRHLITHLESIPIQAHQLSPPNPLTTRKSHCDSIKGWNSTPGCCYHGPHVPLAGCCAALPFGISSLISFPPINSVFPYPLSEMAI